MRLQGYLKQQNITASQFADRIGRSVSTVTRAARGEIIPDSETMRRIVEKTGGAVTPNDFYDIPERQEAANG
jgi:transcriptional regulator with XRE-family HTH domain